MSGYLNRVQLIGNLGHDPEVRLTQAGKKIVTLSIATSESWNDAQSGERRERTEWHRVVIFNEGLAKIAEKFLTKGAKVLIEGKLATSKWKDSDGNDRYTTEIVANEMLMLGGRSSGASAAAPDTRDRPDVAEPAERAEPAARGGNDFDDDIPF